MIKISEKSEFLLIVERERECLLSALDGFLVYNNKGNIAKSVA